MKKIISTFLQLLVVNFLLAQITVPKVIVEKTDDLTLALPDSTKGKIKILNGQLTLGGYINNAYENNSPSSYLTLDALGNVTKSASSNLESNNSWLKLDGTPPSTIDDDIYTEGKVGIGTDAPLEKLDIGGENANILFSEAKSLHKITVKDFGSGPTHLASGLIQFNAPDTVNSKSGSLDIRTPQNINMKTGVGDINLIAGNTNWRPGKAGNINILAGNSFSTGTPGDVTIKAGHATSTVPGGGLLIQSGHGGGSSSGGTLRLEGGKSGSSSGITGGEIEIVGGERFNNWVLSKAGDVFIKGGLDNTTGGTKGGLRSGNVNIETFEAGEYQSRIFVGGYDNYAGKIGIGTTKPTAELHIKGDLRLEDYIADNFDNATPTKYLTLDANGNVTKSDVQIIDSSSYTFEKIQNNENFGILIKENGVEVKLITWDICELIENCVVAVKPRGVFGNDNVGNRETGAQFIFDVSANDNIENCGETISYTINNLINTTISGIAPDYNITPIAAGNFSFNYEVSCGTTLLGSATVNGTTSGTSEQLIWTAFNEMVFDTDVNELIRSTPGATNWKASAHSVNTIPANTDGYIQSVIQDVVNNNNHYFIGLDETGADGGGIYPAYTNIDYGLYVYPGGTLGVFENGVNKYTVGNPTTQWIGGNIIKVQRINNTIYYSLNSNVFYTSTINSTSQLKADVAIDKGVIKSATMSY